MHNCPVCDKTEPKVEFSIRKNGQQNSFCKSCQSKYCKAHYRNNKAKHNLLP